MSKIRFLGRSDFNFTYGNIYQLIKIEQYEYSFDTWISNDSGNIVFIPYSSINTFNENWEVVNE